MTDYLVLTEFVPGTKAKAQEINANFSAVKDAVNSKATTAGDSAQTFSVADATLGEHAVNKTQLDGAIAVSDTKAEGMVNRFCLKSGNLTSGEADLLSCSGTTLSFKIGTGYPSVKLVSANGSLETITSLANITGLSTDGTYSIIKELGIANAFAVKSSSVTQGKTFPTSPSDGDYHCLTAMGLQSYKRISGSWVETQYVPIGTVTVASSLISAVSTRPYIQNEYEVNKNTIGALTKLWVSGEYTPVLNTPTVVSHNLNIEPKKVYCDVLLKCNTAEAGYSVGDLVTMVGNNAGYWVAPPAITTSANSVQIATSVSISTFNKNTGASVNLTTANWRYVFRIWY